MGAQAPSLDAERSKLLAAKRLLAGKRARLAPGVHASDDAGPGVAVDNVNAADMPTGGTVELIGSIVFRA